ncbi:MULTISPECIES: Nramp family divalent metal transporter [Pseudoalteromonas]|uniref:Manganese transporter n=1 Tax=Pseudoalteromonas amylolytica TaxID=1859457 RepID=A0A1S1MNK6_9GAMM|nr:MULTISPECIES: Nramp family divalent metal transporter [Pseudoalteromonas]OHU85052.1 manganese transporter [Pseudoalteromonas sp. JW3]OHU89996.1 manganese transporter [Pseudoalteromonas amylolytica]
MLKRLNNYGPGVIVTAAFIGPGTITACTLAGAQYGYVLLWALVFATVATIILQEMSARVGIVTQKGLGEVINHSLHDSIWKWPLFALIIVAICIGNAAYEAGNLVGAALGIEAITNPNKWIFRGSIIALTAIGAVILMQGTYRQIERILITLVCVMALAFIVTFFLVKPDLTQLFKGLVMPAIPEGSLLTVIALIGTTVVPYNLFLHASTAKSHWSKPEDIPKARSDTIVSIGLGGLIAILVTSTAAASIFTFGLSVNNALDMAVIFEPTFGSLSKYLLGIGLFSAGLSSVITAPLATGYVISEILQLKGDVNSKSFRLITISIVVIGAVLSMADVKPIQIIILAQFANGLLLPIIAMFLLYAMNNRQLLGRHANTKWSNFLGFSVLIFTAVLGVRLIAKALGLY